ncbi:MAG: C-GCAxxG-C-C family protein [Lachnospiraceae bacterium]|nr:C-GCAxxG-C-C family protein [Lachnospiraceae bacterium]
MEQLKQMSAGFGAGMGNMEATCGAIRVIGDGSL